MTGVPSGGIAVDGSITGSSVEGSATGFLPLALLLGFGLLEKQAKISQHYKEKEDYKPEEVKRITLGQSSKVEAV